MGDEIVESVQAEEFKTPVISTRGQAFLLLFKAISFRLRYQVQDLFSLK